MRKPITISDQALQPHHIEDILFETPTWPDWLRSFSHDNCELNLHF